MKRAVTFRVVFLTFMVLIGIVTAFLNEQSKLHTYEKVNNAWSAQYDNIEQVYRQKSRDMLQQGKYCIGTIMADDSIDKGSYDEKLFFAIDTCMKKAKTTQTGDSFAFRTTDYMFIYDPSLDCFVEGGKKFYGREESKEIKARIDAGSNEEFPECYLHRSVDHCFTARTALVSGYDSIVGNDVGWFFDDAEEWLEWVVLPSEDYGYHGINRGNERLKPYQVVLALGVQSDEILNGCESNQCFEEIFTSLHKDANTVDNMIKLLVVLVVMFVLLTSSVDYYYHRKMECPFQDESCPHKDKCNVKS